MNGERAVSFRVTRRAVSDGTPLSDTTPMVDTGTIAVWWWCPGCEEVHAVYVGGSQPGPKWEWNGSLDRPTFAPSIRVRGGAKDQTCHCFVREGFIQFLDDCSHALAGKTVDVPPPPDWLKH